MKNDKWCTGVLRWRKPNRDPVVAVMEATHGKYDPVLQQEWEDIDTGEVEWRDVPMDADA